ncbi:MAG: hypothetical protein JXQ77_06100 [Campylobacterales bacterium]|nr:hypothetical protein [Campylobacterales bacterium]
MKTKYVLLLAALLMMSGCGDKKTDEQKEVVIQEESTKDMKDAFEEIGKTSEDLKKATPLSNEQLKALLPEKIDGLSRKKYSIGQLGMHIAEAQYGEEYKKITLSILDGAGEAGSAMIAMMQIGINAGGESEDENGYRKPIKIDGNNGVEEQERYNNRVANKIILIVKGRFMLTLEGSNIEVDKLKSIIKDEDFIDKLEDLAD